MYVKFFKKKFFCLIWIIGFIFFNLNLSCARCLSVEEGLAFLKEYFVNKVKNLKPGYWIEYKAGKHTYIVAYLGKKKVFGTFCEGLEIAFKNSVSQTWFKSFKEKLSQGSPLKPFKSVIKIPGSGTICSTPQNFNNLDSLNPSYDIKKEKKKWIRIIIKRSFYKFPSGKKVGAYYVAIYGKDYKLKKEYWLAYEKVPFGLLKEKEKGEVVLEAVKYGFNYKPKITKKDLLNCQKAPFIPGMPGAGF